MKRVLAAFLCVALLAMTSEGLSWTMQARQDCAQAARCAKPATACCGDSSGHATEGPVSPATSCVPCCAVCCAVLPPAAETLAAPGVRAMKWAPAAFGSETRGDEPPVPPPRMG